MSTPPGSPEVPGKCVLLAKGHLCDTHVLSTFFLVSSLNLCNILSKEVIAEETEVQRGAKAEPVRDRGDWTPGLAGAHSAALLSNRPCSWGPCLPAAPTSPEPGPVWRAGCLDGIVIISSIPEQVSDLM